MTMFGNSELHQKIKNYIEKFINVDELDKIALYATQEETLMMVGALSSFMLSLLLVAGMPEEEFDEYMGLLRDKVKLAYKFSSMDHNTENRVLN